MIYNCAQSRGVSGELPKTDVRKISRRELREEWRTHKPINAPFFEVDKVTKRFGGLTAIENVSFQMGRDEIIGLISPGKTTLVRMIMGILKPDSGAIRLWGKDMTRFKTWQVVEHGITGTFQTTRPVYSIIQSGYPLSAK